MNKSWQMELENCLKPEISRSPVYKNLHGLNVKKDLQNVVKKQRRGLEIQLNNRALAQQVQGPEFESQHPATHKKTEQQQQQQEKTPREFRYY